MNGNESNFASKKEKNSNKIIKDNSSIYIDIENKYSLSKYND